MSANIVSVDEESLRNDIKNLVRKTVEETLNALLDEEASELVGAERYERTAGREAYRSGHYTRRLVTGVSPTGKQSTDSTITLTVSISGSGTDSGDDSGTTN